MIFMINLRSPHSAARTKSLFSSLALRWCFWQSQKKLTKSAQRAVWATQIIKTIEQSEPPKSIAQPSLRQRILNLQVPSQDYAFDPECRKEVFQLFEGGIALNPIFFDQGRIKLAGQPTSFNKENTQQDAMAISPENQRKFIFCPNSLVTKHIFYYMGRKRWDNFFISGGYGISKTVSIILYLHLSNFITTYFCEASRPNPSATQGQCEEDKVNKAEEMKELQTKQLLREKAYKYFYWSIDTSHYKIEDIIKTLVLEQVHQLSEKERQILTGYDDFSMCLQVFYPPNVQVRSIVDQINRLATMIRRSNYQKEKISKIEQDYIRKQARLAFDYSFIPVSRLSRYLHKFISLGSQFGLNSSAIIQRQLLKIPSRYDDHFTLSLQDRKPLTYCRVPYEKSISSPEGGIEFKQLIWFEIERRLSSCQISQDRVASLKKKFYEAAADISISGFAKFLTVRQIFSKESLFNLIIEKKDENFMEQVKIGLQELEKAGLETEKDLFKKIFDKSKQLERIIIGNLHKIAELQRTKQDKRHQLFQFHSRDIQVDQKLRGYNLSDRLSQTYRNTSKFQENLPYQLLENRMIRLPWTVQQFLIISSVALYPEIAKEYRNLLIQDNIQKLIESGGAMGLQYLYQLRKCLIKGKGTTALMLIFTEQTSDKRNPLRRDVKQIQIKHVKKFFHFNKKSKQSFVDYNFRQLLETSRNHPTQYCVAIPHFQNSKGIQVHSGTSKAVDFIICALNEQNVFSLTTYDATVSTYFPKKIENYKKFYRDNIFADMRANKIDASKFKFRHVIICPKEACKAMKVMKEGQYSYTVQYADALYTALISECQDRKAWDSLKEVQRLLRLQLNNR